MTPLTNKFSYCCSSLSVPPPARLPAGITRTKILQISEHRFQVAMIVRGFILMPKSLNHPICLGSQSYADPDLLYYGGQMVLRAQVEDSPAHESSVEK